MPEFPDFDAIARQIIYTVQMAIDGAGRHPEPVIAEQLWLVWNARGAADIAKVDAAWAAAVGYSPDQLDRAIRSLDRLRRCPARGSASAIWPTASATG